MSTTWTVQHNPKAHAPMGITTRILRQGEIPVLLDIGGYPEAVCDTGETTHTRPYVSVFLGITIMHKDGATTYCANSVTITAIGIDRPGFRRRHLPALRHLKCEARTPEAVDDLLASLSAEIDRAVALCGDIEERYAAAKARIGLITDLKDKCDTRAGYEAACVVAGIEPLADEHILTSYGIQYGDFSFPEYEPDHVIAMALAASRQSSLKKEAEEKRKQEQAQQRPSQEKVSAEIVRQGQVWEGCERCGKEPSYLPLHLCNKCWPGAATSA